MTTHPALDFRVAAAIEFLADPHADARAFDEELVAQGRPPMDDLYPYSFGVARATIAALLDVLGARDHGPTRFDCEWAAAHPYEDEDADEIEFDGDLLAGLRAEVTR